MSAAATRDDLLSVVKALTDEAAMQDSIEDRYQQRARFAATQDPPDRLGESLWEKYAYAARCTAAAYRVSAQMINQYVET